MNASEDDTKKAGGSGAAVSNSMGAVSTGTSSMSNKFTGVKLNENNWHKWSFEFTVNAEEFGLLTLLEKESQPQNDDDRQKRSLILSQLLMCIDESQNNKIFNEHDPAKAWKKLKDP